jgi:hypothetical protein
MYEVNTIGLFDVIPGSTVVRSKANISTSPITYS